MRTFLFLSIFLFSFSGLQAGNEDSAIAKHNIVLDVGLGVNFLSNQHTIAPTLFLQQANSSSSSYIGFTKKNSLNYYLGIQYSFRINPFVSISTGFQFYNRSDSYQTDTNTLYETFYNYNIIFTRIPNPIIKSNQNEIVFEIPVLFGCSLTKHLELQTGITVPAFSFVSYSVSESVNGGKYKENPMWFDVRTFKHKTVIGVVSLNYSLGENRKVTISSKVFVRNYNSIDLTVGIKYLIFKK